MVSAIGCARQVRGMVRIACHGVKINHRVEPAARPDPTVHGLTGPFGFLSRVEGSAKRRDGRPVYADVLGMGANDNLPVSVDDVLGHGSEIAGALARSKVIYSFEDYQPTNAGLGQHVAI